MTSTRWQDKESAEQWDIWQRHASKYSKAKKMENSLGAEDYAAEAIEKLLKQEKKPANIEGWICLTINRQYIHRIRRVADSKGIFRKDLTDSQWEEEMVNHAVGSPSFNITMKESVAQVLAVLNLKEQEILIFAAAGFDNHEIANHLGYKTNKIVATRLGQISQKVKNVIDQSDVGIY
jgi:DNA-directed RNA polymerase specialized sigma24 family protein